MKKILLLICIGTSMYSSGQQNISNNFLSNTEDFSTDGYQVFKTSIREASGKAARKSPKDGLSGFKKNNSIKLPVAGLYGASNLNEESFKTLNASGKASFYFRPVIYRNKAVTIYTSYNINASNNDSILYSTLIFPEVGTNSFLGTLEWTSFWSRSTLKGKTGHTLAPFFEFSHKNIRTDSSEKGKPLSFATLNYTTGIKYTFNVVKAATDEDEKNTEANLSLSAYLSYLNIPDEDIEPYRAILSKGKTFDPVTLDDSFWSLGLKIGGQFNSFGVFADFRAVLGKESKLPLTELRGFHSNIGLIINTEIFHLSL